MEVSQDPATPFKYIIWLAGIWSVVQSLV